MAHASNHHIYLPSLDNEGKRARLTFNTDTNSRKGITSSAHVEFEHADGMGVSFLMFGDFRKSVATINNVRGTQKAIDTQHAATFTEVAQITLREEAIAFYTAKAA
jgi:hypothetical protein